MGANDASAHADTRIYAVVHNVFRRTTTLLADTTERLEPSALQPMFRSRWDFYAAVLHHHHEVEDDSIFPALLAARPDMHELVTTLEDDHQQLIPAMNAVESALQAFEVQPDQVHQQALHEALVAVQEMFLPHLDIEDEKILPAIAESVPPKEWDRLDEAALKSIPRERLPLAVGAIDAFVRDLPDGEQPPPPPVPLRVMLMLSWRKKWSAWVKPLTA
jgi:hemerythrin-like domain-containing protein